MYQCFASWLDKAIKKRAKVILNKLNHILAMIGHIIFNDPGKDSAESTAIVETVAGIIPLKISIGALLLELS